LVELVESFSIELCFKTGKTASEMHGFQQQCHMKTRLLSGILDSGMRKLRLKIASVRVMPPQVAGGVRELERVPEIVSED
jgi:hypothetical protein